MKTTEVKKTTAIKKTTEAKKQSASAKKPAEVKTSNADRKEAVRKELDAWLEEFVKAAKISGTPVEVKTWEKIPTCRSLKVDGVTYFEMYYSANGVRLNAKSSLIPEAKRPKGSNIIKNGLDLTIPTFSKVSENLTKYAAACSKSLADKAAEKAKKQTEKKAPKKEPKEAKKEPEVEAKKAEKPETPNAAK